MVKKKMLAISTALLAVLLSLSLIFPQQTSAADDNGWQVVSGKYEGNGVENKTVTNADVRIQKNVKPTDVENEFQVYMAVDALCMETVTSTAITKILTPDNLNNLYTGGSANGFPECYSGQEHTGNGALAYRLKGSAKNCEPGNVRFKLVITYNENGHDYLIAQPVLSLGVPNSVLYLKVGDDFICLENIQDNGGRITIGGDTPEMDGEGNYIVPVHLTTMAYNALMTSLPVDEETTSSSSIITGEDGSASIADKMGSYVVFDGNASGDIKNDPAAQTEPGGTVNWELAPKPNTAKPAVPAGASKETTTEPESVVTTADEKITTNASTTTYTWTENGVQKVFYEVKKSVLTENLTNGNTEEVTSIISSWWAENLVEITYDAHLAVDKAGFVSGTDYPVNDPTTLYYGEGKSVNFVNPEVEGTLYDFGFTKQDDSGAAMSGVSFTLTGPAGNPDVSSSTRTVTSGSDGKVSVTGLPWGEYTLTEAVPAGYTAAAIDPLQLSYTSWPDNVTHNAAANDVYKFPDAGKVVNTLNKVTVNKAVEVFGDLTESEIEHTIYIALQDKNTGEYVKKSDGSLYYQTITITAGVPSPASVTFEGVPSGEYDVMELASVDPPAALKVNDVVHVSDGTEIQIHGISAVEGDGSSGNDANLIYGVAEAEVSFTNTYAHADEPVKFTARKQWADYKGNSITAPADAEVTFVLYRTAGDAAEDLEEVTSVTLDGTADELAEDPDTHIGTGELTAWEATFDNLPNQDENGYAYTYMVGEIPVDGYAAYNGNVPMDEGDYLTRNGGAITNRKQSTDVTVRKAVSGHNPDNQAFSFKAEYGETSTEFELKDGETKVIKDVPVGAELTVTETAVDNFSTSVKCGDDTAEGTEYTYTVAEPADTIVFTNTREVGSLAVSKTVSSDLTSDQNVPFTFTITLDDDTVTGTFDGVTFENGEASIELKHGQTKNITGLPAGVGYTVTETPAAGFTADNTEETGTISTTASAAEFTNTRETGDLTVSKTVESPLEEDADAEFDFVIFLTGNGSNLSGTYECEGAVDSIAVSRGSARLTLKGGDAVTIKGLPTGIGYEVHEEECPDYVQAPLNADGYPIITGQITTEGADAAFTNTRKASGSVTLEVTKALAGAVWPSGKTLTLTLSGEGDAKMPAATAVNIDKAGEVSFGSIAFDETDIGKEYSYTISEDGFGDGWAGSGDVTAKIKVNDKGGGQLEPVVTYSPENAVITNTYSVEPVEVVLEAAKSLSGRKLQAGEFSFTLSGSGVKETVKNDADGAVRFSAVKYTKPGKYTYTITEDGGDVSKVTYDKHEFAVTVDVTDDGKGKLEAAVTYDGKISVPVFRNTYDPDPAEANISVSKELAGRDMKAGEFEFTLDLAGFVPEDAAAKDETAEEKSSADTPSAEETPVTEEPASDTPPADKPSSEEPAPDTHPADKPSSEEPAAEAPAAEEAALGDVTVEETAYEGKAVSLMPAAFTEVTGEADAADDTSQLNGVEPISLTTKNDAAGLVNFDNIEFRKAGTYTFEIKEKKGGAGGITYDDRTVTVTVEVTYDDAKGEFSAKVKYPENKTFSNKYEPEAASVSFKADKVLNGRAMKAGEFSFTLSGSGVSETVKNAADGSVTFSPVTYDKAGTYTYTIREDRGSLDKVKYDTHEIGVTVTVKDDLKGKLTADVRYEGTKTFVNAYQLVSIDPPVRKSIEGAPEEPETYTFMMEAGSASFPMPEAAGGASSMTVDIEGAGEREFGEIEFTEPGTYWYTVTEVAGDDPDCEYDSSVYRVTAAVTEDPVTHMLSVKTTYEKNGKQVKTAAFEFTNTYTDDPDEPDKPQKPDTGDNNNLAGMLGLAGISAAGLICVFVCKRRKNGL